MLKTGANTRHAKSLLSKSGGSVRAALEASQAVPTQTKIRSK
jgi:hypothetical protein